MNNIFKVKQSERLVRKQDKLNLATLGWNQTKSGEKRLMKVHEPKFWASPPCHIKTSENLNISKNLIKI